jgi:hypothetical protein
LADPIRIIINIIIDRVVSWFVWTASINNASSILSLPVDDHIHEQYALLMLARLGLSLLYACAQPLAYHHSQPANPRSAH